MSSALAIPLPTGDPIGEAQEEFRGRTLESVVEHLRRTRQRVYLTPEWSLFFTQQQTDIQAGATRVSARSLTDQSASIGATDLSDGTLPAGTYLFSWFGTIVRAGGVSSSLTVTLDFTYRGGAKAKSFPAITGNTIGTFDGLSLPIDIDSSSPVRYSTTYASSGAPTMLYDASFVLSRLL